MNKGGIVTGTFVVDSINTESVTVIEKCIGFS